MPGKLTDYVSDIPMEVGPNYLPLPVICLPDEDISLRIPLYEYNFSAEHDFFEFIKNDASSSSNTHNESTLSESASESNLSNGKNAYDVIKLVEFPSPSPFINAETQTRSKELPQQSRSFNEFSEFEEHGKTIFDLMSLKCIDEKAELETLWNLDKK